ncbi:glycosyltransferase involved in cell wall biosynthesis/spore maturation protein CgeB [Arthrobacter sp. CAN_A6]|uniref:glycosyltransferase n=1 Tax=Arthrobacter sp. CAN_A6 TaxID=2787721 RepID=UPI0018CAF81E
MRFDDEVRSQSLEVLAKRSQYLADIDRFISDHEKLLQRRKRDASAVRSLESQLKSVQSANTRLSREAKSLTDDNRKLRSTLTALRQSKRLKIGSAIVGPVRAVSQLFPRALGQTRGSRPLELASATGAQRPTGPAAAVHSSGTQERATGIVPPAGGSQSAPQDALEREVELRKKLEDFVSKANVVSLISHQYFVLGQITEPASIITRHSDVLTGLSAKERQLIDAVAGLDRLIQRPIVLPPQQSNAGYQAERGRVMYCAHSVSPYNSNGYSTRTAGLIKGLEQAGADIVIAARPGYPWDIKTDIAPSSTSSYTEVIDGIDHFFSQGPTWTQSPLDHYIQRAADSYVQVALRNRVERVHAASNYVTALPALIAARRLGLPFSYEVRGLWEITEASAKFEWAKSDRFAFSKSMETFVALESDVVFAITEQVRQELVTRGVPFGKIQILPNAVDTDEFSDMPKHAATAKHLKLEENTPVIGYAGSIVDYEGLETLLDAVAILLAAGIELRTVIVGDGSALSKLEVKARALEISHAVTFTGRVAASDIPNYVSVFDIMPCPRLPLPVTEMVSPLKPLEAMAAAKAVVLSNLAPLRDLSGADGERARLFEAGNATDLARVLEDLLSHPDQRQAMGRRARLWAVEGRTWARIAATALSTLTSSEPVSGNGQLALADLTVGIIADEFTVAGLEPETSLLLIHPGQWESQLSATPIDVLFVESAWEGNDGVWRGKVGFYDDDSFADLRALLEYCRAQSVPTLFWNKEDPVHFNRFQETAKHFDHVFTSDDGSIPGYLASAGPSSKTVASLPFYAQPALHNPLPGTREYSHTVTYAGSYYGARYKKRSEQLATLLAAALPAGLTIYDRQHLNPDSPYKFPPHLAPHVSGGLTYGEMVEAYKAHPVHVNVNSVEQSGTMFSRRVFEVAACGGAVISGPGRGIEQIFGSTIPIVSDQANAQAVIAYWMDNEDARNDDAWLAMRSVFRSHTAAHRLTYALRTAGLQVRAIGLEKYAVLVPEIIAEVTKQLEGQSVRPALVLCETDSHDPQALLDAGITLIGKLPTTPIDRTYYEDLLTSRKYVSWDAARIDSERTTDAGRGLVHLDVTGDSAGADLRSITPSGGPAIVLNRNVPGPAMPGFRRSPRGGKRILVAGHDLKFARGLITHLEAEGHSVEIDQWQGHAQHDEEGSRIKLANADIIFCEWTLGNAVWYANNKRNDQRLICRLHLQELNTPYLGRLKIDSVDQFIFVGKHIAQIAQRDFGIPAEKSVVIPNYVDTESLDLPKDPAARWNLGLVGIVPQRKRLDLALDVLRGLRIEDERYQLFIKGKRPEDFPWMAERTEELAYFLEQYRRIEEDPLLQGAVKFDAQGDDMAEWYRKIGTVLSVSDFESFHLTLADGAASGAAPVTLAWPGADQIYPASWVHPSVMSVVHYVGSARNDNSNATDIAKRSKVFVNDNFRQEVVFKALLETVLGD